MRVVTFCTLLLAIVVFNAIGLPSNITCRALSPNLIVRYGLTDGEMEAMKHITIDMVSNNGGILGSDSYYVGYIQSNIEWYWPQRTKVRAIDGYILSGDFKDCPYNIILLRDALCKEPFAYGSGSIYRLNYNPIEAAQAQGYNIIWQNEEISCLVR